MSRSEFNQAADKEIDHNEPRYIENFEIYKHKKFNE